MECIDGGAYVSVCPFSAIFAMDDLGKQYADKNVSYVQGGKFTPDEYTERALK